MPMQKRKIVIAPSIVFWTIGSILLLSLFWLVRDIVAIALLGIILAAAIEPVIIWLRKMHIPRTWSVLIIYIIFLSGVGLFLSNFIPFVLAQVQDFSRNMSVHLDSLAQTMPFLDGWIADMATSLQSGASSSQDVNQLMQRIFSTTLGVFQGVIAFIAVLAIAFYLSIEENGVERFFSSILPASKREYVVSRAKVVYSKIGYWMVGQLLLMVIIFLLYWALLSALGVPFALVLALLAGLLEIIPYVGPILSAIPALFFAFTVSPLAAFLVALGYLIIQQLENHVLVPQIMRKVLGLHPIVVILALLVGAQIGGVLGIILAIPVVTAAGVFLKDFLEKR